MFVIANKDISVVALKTFYYFKVTFSVTYALSEPGWPVYTLCIK